MEEEGKAMGAAQHLRRLFGFMSLARATGLHATPVLVGLAGHEWAGMHCAVLQAGRQGRAPGAAGNMMP